MDPVNYWICPWFTVFSLLRSKWFDSRFYESILIAPRSMSSGARSCEAHTTAPSGKTHANFSLIFSLREAVMKMLYPVLLVTNNEIKMRKRQQGTTGAEDVRAELGSLHSWGPPSLPQSSPLPESQNPGTKCTGST